MVISEGNTIIIILSKTGRNFAENDFLKKCNAKYDEEKWKYVSTDGKVYGYDVLVKEPKLVLYNQDVDIKYFKVFVSEVNKTKRKVMIYRHITNNQLPDVRELRKMFIDPVAVTSFHHDGGKKAMAIRKKIQEYCNG